MEISQIIELIEYLRKLDNEYTFIKPNLVEYRLSCIEDKLKAIENALNINSSYTIDDDSLPF